ncbi:MAG: aromatic ring-hydroxylating dioxygenase subunit alpha [Myxococcales bacterium]|nr:aromatic ring-hydroxylating dioxygenase subunit alpha [Myxococcales bacterium]
MLGPLFARQRQPFTGDDLARTRAAFAEAKPLPAAVYTDPEVFRLEQRSLLREGWLPMGRAADVPRPGDFMRPPSPWNVLVARGDDLVVRAFQNTCRHRAAELVTAPRGRVASFECPYHGWCYAKDGRLRAAPYAPAGFDAGTRGLIPVALATLGDLLFGRLREGAAQARDVAPVDSAPSWLRETELRHLVRVHEASWSVAANWKLLAENFQESHHFTRVHGSLERWTPNDDARSVLKSGPWLGGTMELVDEAETVSASGKRLGRPYLVAPALRRTVHDAMLFPLLLTSLQPDYLLTYRLVPKAPGQTEVHFDIFAHPEVRSPEAIVDLVDFWRRVNAEDGAICESQQRAFEGCPDASPACYASVEDGVHAFQLCVAEAYASAVAEEAP